MIESCQIQGLEHIYRGFFKENKGVFVEIGGHDGMSYSNTYDLAFNGWRGWYIEPIQSLCESCKQVHKNNNVKVLNCAISNKNGELELFTGSDYATAEVNSNENKNKITVPCYTLNHIIICYEIPKIDLLVIDVEMHEKEVLQGFDLMKWNPRMVIIEAHEYHEDRSRAVNAEFINQYFKGYTRIYSDSINNIYVHD